MHWAHIILLPVVRFWTISTSGILNDSSEESDDFQWDSIDFLTGSLGIAVVWIVHRVVRIPIISIDSMAIRALHVVSVDIVDITPVILDVVDITPVVVDIAIVVEYCVVSLDVHEFSTTNCEVFSAFTEIHGNKPLVWSGAPIEE